MDVGRDFSGINAGYVEELYERYRLHPDNPDKAIHVAAMRCIVSAFGVRCRPRSVMEAHQGKIKIESTPNKGTTMSLFFPNTKDE